MRPVGKRGKIELIIADGFAATIQMPRRVSEPENSIRAARVNANGFGKSVVGSLVIA